MSLPSVGSALNPPDGPANFIHSFTSIRARIMVWQIAAARAVAKTIHVPSAATTKPPTSGKMNAGAVSALKYPL